MDPSVAAATAGRSTGVSSRMPAGGDKVEHTWARLERLCLSCLSVRPPEQWAKPPTAAEKRLAAELRAEAYRKVKRSTDATHLATCLSYVERFLAVFPSRPLFMARTGPLGAEAALAFNAETFELLRSFIERHGSLKPGMVGQKHLPSTVSDYLSALRAAASAVTGGRIVTPDLDARRGKIQKTSVKEAGPRATEGVRKKRLGFRARYFSRVVESSFDRRSPRGDFRWTTFLASWACLMRPGEPGKGGSKTFDWRRGLKRSDVLFWDPAISPNGRWAACLMIVPSKGGTERRPNVIATQGGADGEPCDDPTCVYSHVLRLWRRRGAEVCATPAAPCTAEPFCAACATEPLFAWPGTGVAWSSKDGYSVVSDMCSAIGLDPADHGGYSARIAGASDIKDALGPERGKVVVHQRGRWNGDFEDIYARETASEQLEASALMGSARGIEMEALLPGWVQPTRRWAPARGR